MYSRHLARSGTREGNQRSAQVIDRRGQFLELAEAEHSAISAAFYAMPSSAIVVDLRGKIVVANRLAETVLGFRLYDGTGDETLLQDVFELDTEEVADTVRTALSQGALTLRLRNPSHRRSASIKFRTTLVKGSPKDKTRILLAQDTLKESVEMITSINDHRRLVEIQLEHERAGNRQLSTTLHTMEVFTNAASHDLRTPIAVVRGLLDHLREGFGEELPGSAMEILDVMSKATSQMSDQTEKLLDHARSATGNLVTSSVAVRDVVTKVCDLLAPHVEAANGKINVIGTPAKIMADEALFEVLLTNLVCNAVKYRSPERDLEILVHVEEGARLSVADNGLGFCSSDTERMFRAFEQLDTANERGGTGLGLATCHEICRRHGWKISAKGAKNLGAKFVIDFYPGDPAENEERGPGQA